MFINAKAERISQNIVQQIRQAIFRRELNPGDRLPSEKDLAGRFGASKASLREAYRALEALGLLEVRQGMSGGAFICEVDLTTVRNGLVNYFFFQNPTISEYTQTRKLLEPAIAEIAAVKIIDRDIAYLSDNIEAMKIEPHGEEFNSSLDSLFHKRLADIAKNSIISLFIDSVQHALINIKKLLQTDRDFLLMVCSGHEVILNALRDHDPERAGKAMLQHIEEVEKGMLNCKNGNMVLTQDGCLIDVRNGLH